MTTLTIPATQTDGSKMLVRRDDRGFVAIEIWLRGELPSLRRSVAIKGKNGRVSNYGFIRRMLDKKKFQVYWFTKLLALGAQREIHALQRSNAALGLLTGVHVSMMRRRGLDFKNAVTAADEILLDPLQRPDRDGPILYSDRPSNIDLTVDQSPEDPTYFDGDSFVYLRFSRSDKPCGAQTIKRFKEELKANRGI